MALQRGVRTRLVGAHHARKADHISRQDRRKPSVGLLDYHGCIGSGYEGITLEGQRVSARAAQVTGTQEQKASNDAVAMGVGLVLFWPALFFIKGDSQTAGEVARLRGEMDAIQQASITNNCGITVQTYEAAS